LLRFVHGPVHADLQKLHVPADRVEWSPELVTHHREKIAFARFALAAVSIA
jgi:hypothetical protein